MKYLPLLTMGILIALASIPSLRGSPVLIHRCNRRRVSPEDAPRYGKIMGLGTAIVGASIVLTAILLMIWDVEALFFLILVGCVLGVAVMIYAQIKYNHGIF